jgi:hypothetical protein
MVVERPRGVKGLLSVLLRRLARLRLRTLAIRFPFEVWALKAYKALRRTAPAPAVIN